MMHSGESNTPRTLVERAADRGMSAIEDALGVEDAEAHRIFVIIHASKVPGGEPDCTVAGRGYEDGRELLAELMGHASGVAKELGLRMHVFPDVRQAGQG